MWAFPSTSTPAGPATNLLHHQYTGRVPDTKDWCRQERKPLVLSGSCRIHTESSRTTETIISATVTDTSHPSSLLKHCFSSKQTQLSRSHPRYCPKTLETQSESPLQELGKRCRSSCKQFLPLPPFITPSAVHSKGYIGQLHREYVSSRCIFTTGAGTSLQKHPSNSDMKAYLQSMTFSSAFFFFPQRHSKYLLIHSTETSSRLKINCNGISLKAGWSETQTQMEKANVPSPLQQYNICSFKPRNHLFNEQVECRDLAAYALLLYLPFS